MVSLWIAWKWGQQGPWHVTHLSPQEAPKARCDRDDGFPHCCPLGSHGLKPWATGNVECRIGVPLTHHHPSQFSTPASWGACASEHCWNSGRAPSVLHLLQPRFELSMKFPLPTCSRLLSDMLLTSPTTPPFPRVWGILSSQSMCCELFTWTSVRL